MAKSCKILNYKKSEYGIIRQWWKAHGWAPTPPKMLSDTGYIIEIDGEYVVAGWYVKTNTGGSMLEWIISNPKSSKKDVKKALNLLYEFAEKKTKDDGKSYLMSFLEHKGLIALSEGRGWIPCEKGIDVFMKEVI